MSDPLHGRYALRDGRVVSLARMLLSATYQGALEGTYAQISDLIRDHLAQRVPQELGSRAPLVVLDDGQPELPPYRWAAAFLSIHAVSRTNDPDYSSRLSLCWFTATIPADIHAMIAEALAAVDWATYAEDYDIMP